MIISIHASREGCDPQIIHRGGRIKYFNPRIPRGMRHIEYSDYDIGTGISIHASREGCDVTNIPVSDLATGFQSTHPARDATIMADTVRRVYAISIHASREGCDCLLCRILVGLHYFNPRIPRGMRQYW